MFGFPDPRRLSSTQYISVAKISKIDGRSVHPLLASAPQKKEERGTLLTYFHIAKNSQGKTQRMKHVVIELILNLLPAIILGITGWITQRNPPQNINTTYGFRTKLAMKNHDTWTYANRIAPLVMLRTAFRLAVLGAALTFLVPIVVGQIVVYIAMVVLMLYDVRIVNAELAKIFNDDGSRK